MSIIFRPRPSDFEGEVGGVNRTHTKREREREPFHREREVPLRTFVAERERERGAITYIRVNKRLVYTESML